ncbi:hypothetical protein EMIHUDRAFT_204906 [Emiliania huxleyi CCMP1516]|uniref:Helicase-associated domain-containing protein n=2 Tax=Emiliania huxleyi TaxID=2903 RepID=A0A0D3JWJ6_EMIH1|nr:hypothetical protein EMIHUDRAFT_204906 [Emiliania huxleyi CCMP1516]EOD27881.1 hypothetical protein EMIHUDRAFT_204906 [Emiliania huxleyi CCMP1516]|eukprot:XP_005780310.1 hypothetical protein EMIHUDRAFT_204906 [Emiliania huxleyi CCMP1516]
MLYTVTHAWAAAQSSGIDYSGAAPDWNTIAVQERILWRRRANITAAELPRFTPRGFQSMRTPPHIHAKLLQLYNEKKHFRVREEALGCWKFNATQRARHLAMLRQLWWAWNPRGWNVTSCTTLNFWEADTHLTLKNWVMRELKPVLERWAKIPLEPSVSYGIRIYGPGEM